MPPVSSMVSVPHWRKAKASAGDGACVEVASVDGWIVVRDSKNPDGTWMRYSAVSWREFTAKLRANIISASVS
jgi:uncharacterized protein DUF397